MRIALYQPDIPQNTGAAVRLCAALNVPLDIIEPCGFPMNDSALKRVAMDYSATVELTRHASWEIFESWRHGLAIVPRLLLLTTRAAQAYTEFAFQPDDILLLGRESAGVPDDVHAAADARLVIPCHGRSLNVMMAGAMVLGEGLRQTAGFKAGL